MKEFYQILETLVCILGISMIIGFITALFVWWWTEILERIRNNK